ncbi:hypothetical protein [Brevibacterium luteolum]|uniref:hypothetical protein n=1 Tax=Brevibacterium luteolum TaxID=199591 RepID=UPI00223A80F5|nr:hypothetical protein [Brevibacterium luteolum]MCT1657431.1 hypothetical protein [Brevibacterium luteolum]
MSSRRKASPGTLMTAGLLVMVGLLLVREFVPEGPIAIAALVIGLVALLIIIPAHLRALLSKRRER